MSNLLGNGLLALVRNSDELGRFRENPGLAETALEELLRYDGPVGSVTRLSLSANDGDRAWRRASCLARFAADSVQTGLIPSPCLFRRC